MQLVLFVILLGQFVVAMLYPPVVVVAVSSIIITSLLLGGINSVWHVGSYPFFCAHIL